ncbi:MAG: hypothetical protein ABSG15_02720 [FCB group bacterium]
MKTLKMVLLIMIASLFSSVLLAQVSVGINIGTPRYYYLPDIEAYWDIPSSMYIYMYGGRWIHGRTLPASFGHYDFEHGRRVEIRDYRGSRPYSYFNQHRTNFPKGYHGSQNYWSPKGQKTNRNNGNDKHVGNAKGRGNSFGKVVSHGGGNGHGNGGGGGHGNGGGGGHGNGGGGGNGHGGGGGNGHGGGGGHGGGRGK